MTEALQNFPALWPMPHLRQVSQPHLLTFLALHAHVDVDKPVRVADLATRLMCRCAVNHTEMRIGKRFRPLV
jgi:hypothetical protein